MRLLENDFADAEKLRHDPDSQTEAERQHRRTQRTRGERAEHDAEHHGSTRPLFMTRRRDARAASALLCVTTRIAVPSA